MLTSPQYGLELLNSKQSMRQQWQALESEHNDDVFAAARTPAPTGRHNEEGSSLLNVSIQSIDFDGVGTPAPVPVMGNDAHVDGSKERRPCTNRRRL